MARKKKIKYTMSQWSYENDKINNRIMNVKKSVDDLNHMLAGKKSSKGSKK